MVEAVQAFLATLGPAERAKALKTLDDQERFNWHFTAKLREGLPFKAMTDVQREAALGLLRAVLSAEGFQKAETIRSLEDVLRALEGSARRDKELYYFSVFGQPAEKGVWGWRYEGHHLSLNFTVTDGKVAATTPQFFGANPAEVRDGPLEGTRALAREEDLARSLVLSLSAKERALAVTSDAAPPEILTGASRDASRQEDVGLPCAALDAGKKAALRALVGAHANAQRPELAAERLRRVEAEWDAVRFVWMGALEKGRGHYYRVQGRTFLVEYDNTQNGANHAHTVWRDFENDWGADVLAEHYRTSPHHASRRGNRSTGGAH